MFRPIEFHGASSERHWGPLTLGWHLGQVGTERTLGQYQGRLIHSVEQIQKMQGPQYFKGPLPKRLISFTIREKTTF